jgi:triacylglycerol lipase
VRRLVFLSVPQWGTNIADWVRSYRLEREAVIAQLRASVLAAQVSVVEKVEAWLAGSAAERADADLLLAVQDALAEINVSQAKGPTAVAAALEASAELSLWLRYIAHDFSAIDDLASHPLPNSTSPAHAGPDERERETRLWARRGIKTRSFATVGARPFDFPTGVPAPRWEFLRPSTYPDAGPCRAGAADAMDFVYRYAYRACAGGPFAIPESGAIATRFGSSGQRSVEVWDNDGIVNTASMLWPNAEQTLLVDGDHGDIIGHYRRGAATPPSMRKYHTYDLLRSASQFDATIMQAVWTDVFDFCVS